MSTMASQFTSLAIVNLTFYSGADQRKHQSSASLALCGEIQVTGEFPAQRAGNAENVSIWWRHHVHPTQVLSHMVLMAVGYSEEYGKSIIWVLMNGNIGITSKYMY